MNRDMFLLAKIGVFPGYTLREEEKEEKARAFKKKN